MAARMKAQMESLAMAKMSMVQMNSRKTGQNDQRSKQPSSKWGMASNGNIDETPTPPIGGERKMERIKGRMGQGPSERETVVATEAQQKARRAYREKFAKFKKLSDEVLESESIPLAQRAVIRRYFELIRPRRDR